MKIEQGKKYLCVEENNYRFTPGKIYEGKRSGILMNDDNTAYTPPHNQTIFQPIETAKWAIKRTGENAEVVNKWANEDSIGGFDGTEGYMTSENSVCGWVWKTYTEIDFPTFLEITGMKEEDTIPTEYQEFKNGELITHNQWQPTWGEEVEVSDDGKEWSTGWRYCCKHPGLTNVEEHVVCHSKSHSVHRWIKVRKVHITFTIQQAKEALSEKHNIPLEQIKIVD